MCEYVHKHYIENIDPYIPSHDIQNDVVRSSIDKAFRERITRKNWRKWENKENQAFGSFIQLAVLILIVVLVNFLLWTGISKVKKIISEILSKIIIIHVSSSCGYFSSSMPHAQKTRQIYTPYTNDSHISLMIDRK